MSWLANKLLIAILVMAMQSTELHTPAHTHKHTYIYGAFAKQKKIVYCFSNCIRIQFPFVVPETTK